MDSLGGGVRDGFVPSCTHPKLVLFQDDFGAQRCSVCHTAPQFGSLYRCTLHSADGDGVSELSDLEEDMRKFNVSSQSSIVSGDDIKTMMSDLTRYNAGGAVEASMVRRQELSLWYASAAVSRRSTLIGCGFHICQPCRRKCHEETHRPSNTLVEPRPKPQTQYGVVCPGAFDVSPPTTMKDHRNVRFYSQIPPHLIDDYRSPSVSTTATDDEEHVTSGNGGDKPSTGRRVAFSNVESEVKKQDDEIPMGHIGYRNRRGRRGALANADTRYPFKTDSDFNLASDPVHPRLMYSPPPSPPPKDTENSRDSTSTLSSTDSRVRGKFYDEATIKAMLEEEKRKEMPLDLDEDSKEKRAGRRCGEGRFFID